jgi:hypothetical protein
MWRMGAHCVAADDRSSAERLTLVQREHGATCPQLLGMYTCGRSFLSGLLCGALRDTATVRTSRRARARLRLRVLQQTVACSSIYSHKEAVPCPRTT